MSSVPDTERDASPTLEEAERASHDLKDQLARARGVVGKYREMLARPAGDDGSNGAGPDRQS